MQGKVRTVCVQENPHNCLISGGFLNNGEPVEASICYNKTLAVVASSLLATFVHVLS
jgi:hypothetical protein